MFGASVKVWRMEDEGEEFSMVITHNTSVKNFLVLYLDLLETEFLVSKHTVEAIRTVSTVRNNQKGQIKKNVFS
jgi:hypothetical protein